MPPWHIQENKWRAARYGLDAIIILDAEGNEQLVTEHLRETIQRLEPVAAKLGCSAELADVEKIIQRGVPVTSGSVGLPPSTAVTCAPSSWTWPSKCAGGRTPDSGGPQPPRERRKPGGTVD